MEGVEEGVVVVGGGGVVMTHALYVEVEEIMGVEVGMVVVEIVEVTYPSKSYSYILTIYSVGTSFFTQPFVAL